MNGTFNGVQLRNISSLKTTKLPLGLTLAFFDQASGAGAVIWTIPIENDSGELRAGKPELFLKSPSVRSYPVFSPDGHWLAYASTESGGYAVYVRAFPDNGERSRISSSGGMHPVWARNGHELFYRDDDERIMVVSYAVKGNQFVADKPRVWGERRVANTGLNPNFDVAPDGKRIAALMPAEEEEPRETQGYVTLVLNFSDEVRRRVAAGNK